MTLRDASACSGEEGTPWHETRLGSWPSELEQWWTCRSCFLVVAGDAKTWPRIRSVSPGETGEVWESTHGRGLDGTGNRPGCPQALISLLELQVCVSLRCTQQILFPTPLVVSPSSQISINQFTCIVNSIPTRKWSSRSQNIPALWQQRKEFWSHLCLVVCLSPPFSVFPQTCMHEYIHRYICFSLYLSNFKKFSLLFCLWALWEQVLCLYIKYT